MVNENKMLRIVALNEECSDEELEEEIAATKEAQETIAETEYIRAIKLKSLGKTDLALSLLKQLLETKVLNEILADDKNDKLWSIRYNCHKNIAIICEERQEFKAALRNYSLAVQIDDSDVYTMHRFGQLALKTDELELAEFAFEKCLRYNPAHWNAADGLLQAIYRSQNVLGAYGWAVKLYRRDPSYERATQAINAILSTFKESIPLFEQFWGHLPTDLTNHAIPEENSLLSKTCEVESFPQNCESSEPERDVQQFRIKTLNWISVGEYIMSVYSYLEESGFNMFFSLSLADMVDDYSQGLCEDNTSTEPDNMGHCESTVVESSVPDEKTSQARPNGFPHELDARNEDLNSATLILPVSDQNTDTVSIKKKSAEDSSDELDQCGKLDGADTSKPKPRRRCSDLHFLEQWGWHKNRRYNSRKKAQPDRVEVDTSLNGILRKLFAKYFNTSFERAWPFNTGPDNVDYENTIHECTECRVSVSTDVFQKETHELFDAFINKLEDKHFDLLVLIFEWLKFVSKIWNKCLPEALKRLYLAIFNLYLRHFDFSSWNQLPNKTLQASYGICLLFLELEYTTLVKEKRETTKWKSTFDKLMFRLGCAYVALETIFDEYKLRLINLEYLWHSFNNDLGKCVACLQEMKEIITSKHDSFVLHLPNLNSACITKALICSIRVELQRRIDLKKVPKLFELKKWSDLVHIIKNDISHSREALECEDWVLNFRTQMEILLQSLWGIGAYEECLEWAENFLHYTTYQYLKEAKNSNRQKLWAESVNFIFSYVEALIINEGFDLLSSLGNLLARMVQNVIRLLSSQLDASFDKSCNPVHELEIKRPWIILHKIMLKDECCSPVIVKPKNSDSDEDDDVVPHSFLVLFTAHKFLGKRQWCTRDNGGLLNYILDMIVPNLRAPLYDTCRDVVYEYLEQVTYCLYGYPQKKARSRHLEDHEAVSVELTWPRAVQVFDLYRPEFLPEFNSYKLESISADMEQFVLKIVALMPEELDPTPTTTHISEFISGNAGSCAVATSRFVLPYKINSIFYLLADHYFKNRDFSKAIKYYTLDLAASPGRFDSWAGIALSKASKIETKLNGLLSLDPNSLLAECEDAIRCFEMCISLNRTQTLLWIEYGSFTYTIHSYCSRNLKQSVEKLSAEQVSLLENRQSRMLNIAYNCFSLAATLQNAAAENDEENDDSHEERWLCQYMLGKIAEKRKEHPKVYLNCYLTAANYLYDSNATYPIKINHSNPTTLSVEALEVFYRTNSSIIKFLEREQEVSRDIGNLFNSVLKSLASSPFAFNKAKIDGNSLNALKRKIVEKAEQINTTKVPKKSVDDQIVASRHSTEEDLRLSKAIGQNEVAVPNVSTQNDAGGEQDEKECKKTVDSNLFRRESQESAATGTTTTVTSSTTSFSSSSDSSSSESDTESEESSLGTDPKKSYTASELDNIYKGVVCNLEECATRFPEHYKSIYRLVYHYMNAPPNHCDLNRCEQLLLNQYKTSLENQVNGLFYDRKNNNIFNGIWRIPSSEIDRPGSFSAHLVKCASVLIRLLLKNNNYKLLIDVSLQLFKTPDPDKRYIKDNERVALYQKSIAGCGQILRNLLRVNMESRNDVKTLNLLVDIYKIHKKCIKYMNHKEPVFTQLLVDVYKFYIQNKVDFVPENLNFLDLAIKLCLQETSVRKNMEKINNSSGKLAQNVSSSAHSSHSNAQTVSIPGLTLRSRGRPSGGKPTPNMGGTTPYTSANSAPISPSPLPLMMPFNMQTDLLDLNKLMEYYKTFVERKPTDDMILASLNTSKPASSSLTLPNPIFLASSLPIETTITPAQPMQPSAKPDRLFSSRITNCDITITPAIPKSSAYIHAGPTQAQGIATSTKTLVADSKPSEDIELKVIQSQPSHRVPGCEVFMKPVPNVQIAEPKGHSVDLATISTSTISQPNLDDINASNSKLLNKSKSCNSYKQSACKPYPGFSDLSSSTNLLPSPTLPTFNIDQYTHQMKLLSTYADLLKNTSLHQFQIPAQKSHAGAKRKGKQSSGLTGEINALSTITKTSSATCSFALSEAQQVVAHSSQPGQNPFCYPTCDTNAVTMIAVSTPSTQSSSSVALPNSSFATTSSLQPAFGQQQQTAISDSPTKTLQQKLAERKKAHQLTESSKPLTTSDVKPNIDVIILD